MNQIQVREAHSEVLVFLDKNMGSRLNALEEAAKIIQREVIRERNRANTNLGRTAYSDELPGS